MKKKLVNVLKKLGIAFTGFYILVLFYGTYSIGLEKMLPWIFFSCQLVLIVTTIKSQKILKEINSIKESCNYKKG